MSNTKVTVHSVHFDADIKLVEFNDARIHKLTKLFDHVVEAEVFLKLENGNTNGNKVSEIRLFLRGNDLFAKKNAKTFEEATDLTVEALRRQLKKRKEKVLGL